MKLHRTGFGDDVGGGGGGSRGGSRGNSRGGAATVEAKGAGAAVIGRARKGVAAPPSLADALREAGISGLDDASPFALEIGERIRVARLVGGITQAELSRRAGVSQGDLSNIERGKGRDGPSYKTLRAIAEALDVELAVNPRPAPPAALIAVDDEARIGVGAAAFAALAPLYAADDWGRLRERMAIHWRELPGAPALPQPLSLAAGGAACQVFAVEPGQRASFRGATELCLVGRLRGAGAMRVKAPVYRFQDPDGEGAIAILGPDSALTVETAGDDRCVFMAVPATALLADID